MAEVATRKGPVKGECRDRDKGLDLALSQIEKLSVKGAIMRMGSTGALLPVPVVSTGSTG